MANYKPQETLERHYCVRIRESNYYSKVSEWLLFSIVEYLNCWTIDLLVLRFLKKNYH